MIRRLSTLVLALGALLAVAGSPAGALPAHWEESHPCPNVTVVGARGSSEERSPNGADDYRGFGPRAVHVLEEIVATFEPVGIRVGAVSIDYPAVGVGESLLSLITLSERGFGSSIDLGVTRLIDTVDLVRRACPSTVIVLAGYSQGAEVIRRALASGIPQGDDVAGVVLISDPMFVTGDADAGVHLHGTFQEDHEGIRTVVATVAPSPWVAPRTFSICDQGDIVCQWSRNGLPVGLLSWQTGVDIHLGYRDTDIRPIVLVEVVPLVKDALDPATITQPVVVLV